MLTLADALEAITRNAVRIANATAVINEAAINSRQVIPGSLFVAIPGENVDGHDFIGDAFKRGASFALIQKEMPDSFRTLDLRDAQAYRQNPPLTFLHLSACVWIIRLPPCNRSRVSGAANWICE